MPILLQIVDRKLAREHRFEKYPISIGRLPSSQVVIKDAQISRRHARIVTDGVQVLIEDLDSTNFVYVNGVRKTRSELAHGDLINIGGVADYVFLLRKDAKLIETLRETLGTTPVPAPAPVAVGDASGLPDAPAAPTVSPAPRKPAPSAEATQAIRLPAKVPVPIVVAPVPIPAARSGSKSAPGEAAQRASGSRAGSLESSDASRPQGESRARAAGTSTAGRALALSAAELAGLAAVASMLLGSGQSVELGLAAAVDGAIRAVRARRGMLLAKSNALGLGDPWQAKVARTALGEPLGPDERAKYARELVERASAMGVTTNSLQLDLDTALWGTKSLPRGMREVLCTPLRAADQVLGAIYADGCRTDGTFDPRGVLLFEHYARWAAVGLEKQRTAGLLIDQHRKLVELGEELQVVTRELRAARGFGKPAAGGATEAKAPVAPPSPSADASIPGLLGRSRDTVELFARTRQISRDFDCVLLEGELGTGKKALARAIHGLSGRSRGPFVQFSCAAHRDAEAERRLFGFVEAKERPAAVQPGELDRAEGGVLLLADIDRLPLSAQGRLLEFMTQKTFQRVGSDERVPADVKILATTTRSLKDEVERGTFLHDLFYYRIGVVTLHLRPLSERPEDTLEAALAWLETFNKAFRKSIRGISEEVKLLLEGYPWRSNLLELKNTLEAAVMVGTHASLELADLPPAMQDFFRLNQAVLRKQFGPRA